MMVGLFETAELFSERLYISYLLCVSDATGGRLAKSTNGRTCWSIVL